jgi:hypothetical protein
MTNDGVQMYHAPLPSLGGVAVSCGFLPLSKSFCFVVCKKTKKTNVSCTIPILDSENFMLDWKEKIIKF